MDRTDETRTGACASCGCALAAAPQRAFGFGDEQLLCWDCAVERGGSYDADQDRWSVAPRVADLIEGG